MNKNNTTPEALAGASGASENNEPNMKNSIQPSNTPCKAASEAQETNNLEAPQPFPWPSSFKLGHDGVYKTEMRENEAPVDSWVFSPLIIEARTRDSHEQNWGLLLRVKTPNGKWHHCVMPMQDTTTNAYKDTLLNLGLRLAVGAQKHLHAYLTTASPARCVRFVPTIGWHNEVYVLPNASYGIGKEEIALQPQTYDSLFQVKGLLRGWQENIGKYCPGNSRLIFAICAAFTAPLLELCNIEGGGVHFLGQSSIGKSLLLQVAGSAAGGGGKNGFLRRWRATDNALESVALAHNDALLCLDEIGQVAPRVAAEVSYMLSNGQGKARSTKEGLVRPTSEWRLIFLSNGELSLEQKLQEEGRRYMAGQAVRVLDIPADAGVNHGIFENLHEFSDGKAFAEHLSWAAMSFYGTPLRSFVQRLTFNLPQAKQQAVQLLAQYERQLSLNGSDGQVSRAAKRFALFAAAGEMAISFGILPWEPGTAFEAARLNYKDWVAFRGGLGAAEARDVIRRVRAFIATNRTSRFEPWENGPEVFHNSVGFRREYTENIEFMIYQDAFKKEVCLGGEAKSIALYLLHAGFLDADGAGSLIKPHKPPRLGRTVRFYTIKGAILDAED